MSNRFLVPALMSLATIAACASTPAGPPDAMLLTSDDARPINVKLAHDVQASSPGNARCLGTTAAQNATGAAVTNSVRASAGLRPVNANAELARAAAAHACDMAKRGRMTHVGSTTRGPSQRVKSQGYAPLITAENIAAGPFGLNRVLKEWSMSSGHHQNMLIRNARDFGLGHAVGADGKTVYWSAVYAAPK